LKLNDIEPLRTRYDYGSQTQEKAQLEDTSKNLFSTDKSAETYCGLNNDGHPSSKLTQLHRSLKHHLQRRKLLVVITANHMYHTQMLNVEADVLALIARYSR